MRWTWPSWMALGLGGVALLSGVALIFMEWPATDARLFALGNTLLLGSLLLFAAGLHGLQGAASNCCDYGCGCDHCGECRDDGCCGECECGPGEGGPVPPREGELPLARTQP